MDDVKVGVQVVDQMKTNRMFNHSFNLKLNKLQNYEMDRAYSIQKAIEQNRIKENTDKLREERQINKNTKNKLIEDSIKRKN